MHVCILPVPKCHHKVSNFQLCDSQNFLYDERFVHWFLIHNVHMYDAYQEIFKPCQDLIQSHAIIDYNTPWCSVEGIIIIIYS